VHKGNCGKHHGKPCCYGNERGQEDGVTGKDVLMAWQDEGISIFILTEEQDVT